MKTKYSVLKDNITERSDLVLGIRKTFPEKLLVQLTLEGWHKRCILSRSGVRVWGHAVAAGVAGYWGPDRQIRTRKDTGFEEGNAGCSLTLMRQCQRMG